MLPEQMLSRRTFYVEVQRTSRAPAQSLLQAVRSEADATISARRLGEHAVKTKVVISSLLVCEAEQWRN